MAKKKKNDITIRSSAAEYLTFVASTGDDQGSFEMRYQEENIEAVVKEYLITADDGKNYRTKHYNLITTRRNRI